MPEDLLIDRRDGVVEVTFHRPERRNAFTQAMYAALHDLADELALGEAEGRVRIKVVDREEMVRISRAE